MERQSQGAALIVIQSVGGIARRSLRGAGLPQLEKARDETFAQTLLPEHRLQRGDDGPPVLIRRRKVRDEIRRQKTDEGLTDDPSLQEIFLFPAAHRYATQRPIRPLASSGDRAEVSL